MLLLLWWRCVVVTIIQLVLLMFNVYQYSLIHQEYYIENELNSLPTILLPCRRVCWVCVLWLLFQYSLLYLPPIDRLPWNVGYFYEVFLYSNEYILVSFDILIEFPFLLEKVAMDLWMVLWFKLSIFCSCWLYYWRDFWWSWWYRIWRK